MSVESLCSQAESLFGIEDKKKVLVRFVTENVLRKIYRNAETLLVSQTETSERLFEVIWAQVQNEELVLPPETWKKLVGKIYKDLCRIWSGGHHLLCLLNLNNPLLDATVGSVFKFHLTKPQPRPNAVGLFFSSVYKSLSKRFRGLTKAQTAD